MGVFTESQFLLKLHKRVTRAVSKLQCMSKEVKNVEINTEQITKLID